MSSSHFHQETLHQNERRLSLSSTFSSRQVHHLETATVVLFEARPAERCSPSLLPIAGHAATSYPLTMWRGPMFRASGSASWTKSVARRVGSGLDRGSWIVTPVALTQTGGSTQCRLHRHCGPLAFPNKVCSERLLTFAALHQFLPYRAVSPSISLQMRSFEGACGSETDSVGIVIWTIFLCASQTRQT